MYRIKNNNNNNLYQEDDLIIIYGYCHEHSISTIPIVLIQLIIKFYQMIIIEGFIKCGKGFKIVNYGTSLIYSSDGGKLNGTSALCINNVSLNNGIEQYEWVFRLDKFPDLGRYEWSNRINIGIINTKQNKIDISNVYVEQVAKYDKDIKAYGIGFEGTTLRIEDGIRTQGGYRNQYDFKVNDMVKIIVNFKRRYLLFKKNETVLYAHKNCKMHATDTFSIYCTLSGNILNDFQLSLINFKTQKYISNTVALCQRISAAFDGLRDKILFRKQVLLFKCGGWKNEEEKEVVWKNIGKGVLCIYFDKQSNCARMVFHDVDSEIKLLQFIGNETAQFSHKGDDYVVYYGCDYTDFVEQEQDKIQHVKEWLQNKVQKPQYIESLIYKHGWSDLSRICYAFKRRLLNDLAKQMGIDERHEAEIKQHIQELSNSRDNINNEDVEIPLGCYWKMHFLNKKSEECVKQFVDILKHNYLCM